jgi:hypothetical protein
VNILHMKVKNMCSFFLDAYIWLSVHFLKMCCNERCLCQGYEFQFLWILLVVSLVLLYIMFRIILKVYVYTFYVLNSTLPAYGPSLASFSQDKKCWAGLN